MVSAEKTVFIFVEQVNFGTAATQLATMWEFHML
jgi:hypothetical protein